MPEAPADPKVIELIELWDRMATSPADRMLVSVMESAFGLVDRLLQRTAPPTLLSDRIAWTGSPFADMIGARYEGEDALILSPFVPVGAIEGVQSPLTVSLPSTEPTPGYHLFDYEGFSFPDMELFEEEISEEAVEQAVTVARRRRSLFEADHAHGARAAAGKGRPTEEKVERAVTAPTEPASSTRAAAAAPARRPRTRGYPARMGAAARTLRPAALKAAGRAATRSVIQATTHTVEPEVAAAAPTLAAVDDRTWLAPHIERPEPTYEAGVEVEPLAGAEPVVSEAARPETTPAAPAAHRIDDIRVHRKAMPGMAAALDRLSDTARRWSVPSASTLTSTVDFRPLAPRFAPQPRISDLPLDAELVAPVETTDDEASAAILDSALSRPPVTAKAPKAAAAAESPAWSLRQLTPAPAAAAARARREAQVASPVAPERPVEIPDFGEAPQITTPTAAVEIASVAAPESPAAWLPPLAASLAEPEAHPAESRRRPLPRPIIGPAATELTLSPSPEAGAPEQPAVEPTLQLQDLSIAETALPALAVALAEAGAQVGHQPGEVASAARFSMARAEQMLRGVTMSVPVVAAGEPGDAGEPDFGDYDLIDATLVEEPAFGDEPTPDAPGVRTVLRPSVPSLASEPVEAPAPSARRVEPPTLRALVSGPEPAAPAPIPLEDEVRMRTAAGLALSLRAPVEDLPQAAAPAAGEAATPAAPAAAPEQPSRTIRLGPAAPSASAPSLLPRLDPSARLRAALPAPVRQRAEMLGWSPEALDALAEMGGAEAMLLAPAAREAGFWGRIERRGDTIQTRPAPAGPLGEELVSSEEATAGRDLAEASSERRAAPEPTAAPTIVPPVARALVDRAESPQPDTKATKATPAPSADAVAPATARMGRAEVRALLVRAARSAGTGTGGPLPRLVEELHARLDAPMGTALASDVLQVEEMAGFVESPEAAHRLATALRRELRVEGLDEAAFLQLPVAFDEVATDLPASGAAVDTAAPVAAPAVSALGAPVEGTTKTDAAPTAGAAPATPAAASSPRSDSFRWNVKIARQLGRSLATLLADRGTGLGLPGLRWERGPGLMPVEGFLDEALAEPGILAGLGELGSGGAVRTASAGSDLGATLVQPWFADALTESLRGAFEAPARQAEAMERPGRAMGLALSRALGGGGPVAERLRALVAAGGESSQAAFAAMGWEGIEHLRSDSGRGLPPPGGGRGSPSDFGELPAMAPVTEPQAPAVPLGVQPTGTSMDMGKLTSLMLRPGPASQLDFNLVAPVSVAMSQVAHLKPEDEAVGGQEAVGAASGEETEGGGPSDEPLRIPDEIIDLLSHEIAGRIGDRMKFEQDRRGRWD